MGIVSRSSVLLAVPLFALFALLTLTTSAQPSPTPPYTDTFPGMIHVSIHCQLDYREVGPSPGPAGYLVVALHDDPEAGQLGPIRFKVGDVILAVGNHAAAPGDRLDVLINLAYADEARTVLVLDAVTGELRLLSFQERATPVCGSA